MGCDEWEIRISGYIDGELHDADAARMFEHLARCSACRDFLGGMFSVRHALLNAPPETGRTTLSGRAQRRRETSAARRADSPPLGLPRAMGRRKIGVSLVSLVLMLAGTVAGTVGIGWLWSGAPERAGRGATEIMYVTTLPEVNVVPRPPLHGAPSGGRRAQ